jgi:FKBP-type peptidyl-prolyl cis-trans isomerase 2
MTLITVTLSGASTLTVTVNYATSNGTATAGSDYAGTSGVLTFPPGVTSQAFPVTILNDTLDELDETVFLALSAPTNATLGPPNSATLTIVDDDVSPTVQFSSPTYSVGEADGTTSVTVNLSTASGLTVTVNYAASDGTATAGSDYTATNGTLTFAPGVTSQTFPVTILDDGFDEADETVALALSVPTNAALGVPNTATLTIVDNDTSPTVQFSSSNYTVIEANGAAPITVTLSAASGVTVTVDYASSDLTATAGSDYLIATGTLTFTPGITSQIFLVTISNDNLDEPDETIRLTLSNPNNATPGTPSIATLTIIDEDVPGSCPGNYPNGEPNVGLPNGNYVRIACGVEMIVDLSTPINMGDPGIPDLVYYEVRPTMPPTPPPPNVIFMDLVQVQIGPSPSGPWYTIFNWGDGGAAGNDINTNIYPTYPDTGPGVYPAGADNTPMASPPLSGAPAYPTGILIDVDSPPAAVIPPGVYQYMRIFAPSGPGNDGPTVDAIEMLP